jgi:hypothetical protein
MTKSTDINAFGITWNGGNSSLSDTILREKLITQKDINKKPDIVVVSAQEARNKQTFFSFMFGYKGKTLSERVRDRINQGKLESDKYTILKQKSFNVRTKLISWFKSAISFFHIPILTSRTPKTHSGILIPKKDKNTTKLISSGTEKSGNKGGHWFIVKTKEGHIGYLSCHLDSKSETKRSKQLKDLENKMNKYAENKNITLNQVILAGDLNERDIEEQEAISQNLPLIQSDPKHLSDYNFQDTKDTYQKSKKGIPQTRKKQGVPGVREKKSGKLDKIGIHKMNQSSEHMAEAIGIIGVPKYKRRGMDHNPVKWSATLFMDQENHSKPASYSELSN